MSGLCLKHDKRLERIEQYGDNMGNMVNMVTLLHNNLQVMV